MENLAAKDGMKAPAEMVEPAPSGTVELASRDLELQEIQAQPEPAPEPPTHAEPKPARRVSRANELATRNAPPPAELLAAEAAYGAPTRIARAGRWLRRKAIIALVTLTVVGVGGYFALPHLPPWMANQVHEWIRALPAPIGGGSPTPRAESPPP